MGPNSAEVNDIYIDIADILDISAKAIYRPTSVI